MLFFHPKNSHSHGGSGPHLIHASLGLPDSITQTASQSVQPFLHSSRQCRRACPGIPFHQKTASSDGDLDPHLIMVPWAHLSSHFKQYLDRFSHFCTAHITVSSGMSAHALPLKIALASSHRQIWTPCNTWFLGPYDSASQMASPSGQPFLHSSPQSVPILYNGLPFPLKITPSHQGMWTPI